MVDTAFTTNAKSGRLDDIPEAFRANAPGAASGKRSGRAASDSDLAFLLLALILFYDNLE